MRRKREGEEKERGRGERERRKREEKERGKMERESGGERDGVEDMKYLRPHYVFAVCLLSKTKFDKWENRIKRRIIYSETR